jgi:hypothetical protein
MFVDDQLKNHLETSATIKGNSFVVAEWNMNFSNNIQLVGNYRNRPENPASKFRFVPSGFDPADVGKFYTNATDADISIENGFEDDGETPAIFTEPKLNEKLLYSLEDCFARFRPRSGINKLRYFDTAFVPNTDANMSTRPRYYAAHKNDTFKYWTSYRTTGRNVEVEKDTANTTDTSAERGIANKTINGKHYIQDAAPFVVYKTPVPANRVVVKMQTHVGTSDIGIVSMPSGNIISDPFSGRDNMQIPVRWKIQGLDKTNSWVDLMSFNEASTRADGTPVIKEDGYVEIGYGLIVPEKYRNIFVYAGEYRLESELPVTSLRGYTYKVYNGTVEQYFLWDGDSYVEIFPKYGWQLLEDSLSDVHGLVTKLVDPVRVGSNFSTSISQYSEFQYLYGLRIVVDTMNKYRSTFDLIELSPRLTADITGMTNDITITKAASDLGVSGMPVGQLIASTGTINLFDFEQAFNELNQDSIIANFSTRNLQVKVYEKIREVEQVENSSGQPCFLNFYIPIKTLYAEGFPTRNVMDRSISISLRDMFHYLESNSAPEIFIQNASMSYAVSLLLDSIGFSNYTFKRNSGEPEDVIPFFFTGTDISIAEILNEIAVATQSAMFFDEYNNLVVMSKGYIMPTESQRQTDIVLRGNTDFAQSGIVKNARTSEKLANIVELERQESDIYNDGAIQYTARSIDRQIGSIFESENIQERSKSLVYRVSNLWQIPGAESVRKLGQTDDNYKLIAVPLNSDLSANIPSVVNGVIINNVIDLGEGIDAAGLPQYSGYLYANGEIIRYDAVEYSVPKLSQYGEDLSVTAGNNVWITDTQEYVNYLSKLPLNAKMYATGLVRIYTEPNYQIQSDGTEKVVGIAKHGRGQFGTPVVSHPAGLSSYWSDNANVFGCKMESSLIFALKEADVANVSVTTGAAGIETTKARQTTRNGIIKNYIAKSDTKESVVNNYTKPIAGSVQASALVMNGPSFEVTEKPVDHITYINKKLNSKFVHFGTRMRIVTKYENNEYVGQMPVGGNIYYGENIVGGSGGLGVMVDPATNNGYFFEIMALSSTSSGKPSASFENTEFDVVFYKTVKNASSTSSTDKAVPVRLWGKTVGILGDDGNFVGQSRVVGEENTTVYDLAVEYEDFSGFRRFYLYINNTLQAVVDDKDKLPIFNNMSLFVRGSSRVMFENVYALGYRYSQNSAYVLDTPVNSAFGDTTITSDESLRKYAISGMIQSTYLSGISSGTQPAYNLYYEEFGTIMREAAYFNIKYDKAYPALVANMSPRIDELKSYVVSGLTKTPYGAEFLVFNATDTTVVLDSGSGSGLNIVGIATTQDSALELTMDEYFSKAGDLSNPRFANNTLISSPLKTNKLYEDIMFNRITYGRNEFSISSNYIQSQDQASRMMGWLSSKISKPRLSIGAKIFALPTLQLGDIVKVEYETPDGIRHVDQNSRFVVYNIEYRADSSGPDMTVYLSEVV